MKKVLSLVLVLAMVLGMMPVFAAGETGAEQLYKYGFVAGNNGDLMVDKTLTRAEMAVLYAEMFGLKDEAANYAAPANFSDVNEHWSKPYVAYAQAQGWMGGYPDGTFKPEAAISGQEFATVMLKALGQFTDWNNVVADAKTVGLDANTAASLTRGDAFETMWKAVNMPAKGETVALGVKLGKLESAMVSEGPLAVDTVTANTAKSFEIKFKNVVADTTKVTFEVKRDTTKVALTAAWNEAKTVATLSSAAKFSEGNYEITVNDAAAATPVALGTFKVTIEKEKVAAVEFDSDTLLRLSDIQGVVGYKVVNQYGEEVTDGTLGRSLEWISSTDKGADADEKTGVVTVTQGTDADYNSQLRTFETVVLTVRDTSTGFVSTKTLKVSDTISVVNEVKINGIVNEKDEAVDFAFDVAKTYYLDITVLDANGKEVKSYAILNATVGTAKQEVLKVESTNKSIVTVKPEKHPERSGEMAYRLQFMKTESETYDTPITFLAISPYSGKSATATYTLGRSTVVEKFVLQSPSETVSSGKTVEFPFEAFDQNGNVVTDFDKLDTKIKFSGIPTGDTLEFTRQADGSAKLFGTFTNGTDNDVSVYISATVDGSTTGSYSQVSITVKEKAIPETIQSLAHTYAYTTGASWNKRISNMNIYDQFDNKMNLRNDKDNKDYKVRVTSSNQSVIGVGTNDALADAVQIGTTSAYYVDIFGEIKVYFVGGASYGSSTITYELLDGTNKVIDSSSAIAYNIDPKDITSAILDGVEGTEILMLEKDSRYYTGGNITEIAYKEGHTVIDEPDLYGKTAGGSIVRLPDSMIAGFTVDNSKFTVLTPLDAPANAYEVIANGSFGDDKTATATVTGLVYGTKGMLQASANITASSAVPVAKNVFAWYSDSALRAGTIEVTNDVVSMSVTTLEGFDNVSLLYFDKAGNTTNASLMDFEVDTQYGGSNGTVDRINVVRVATGTRAAGAVDAVFTVDTNGVAHLSGGAPVSGDEWSITASAGAYSKTIVFKVK